MKLPMGGGHGAKRLCPRYGFGIERRNGFVFQTAYTDVVARLDRAIQYSRDGCVFTRRHGVLDAPHKAGHDE
jgi:hypothetical protein